MLEEIRIYGKGNNSHETCNVILTFECVECSPHDCVEFHESYAVLHRVQIEPTTLSTLLLDCPLDDYETREHFESLLSAHCCGYPVSTAVMA